MATILIAILIAVFFFFPLMTYIIFWYDTGNSPYRDELAEESGGKTTIWILKGLPLSRGSGNRLPVIVPPLPRSF
ncbi:MAG: hypothetical protein JRF52_05310 [Deltaproteobacteria bacterium]|nr:hypothetical protein [Deltaproteobacteria bacterium]